MTLLRTVGLCALAAIAIAAGGCGDDSTSSPVTPSGVQNLNIQDIASSASADGIEGARSGGAAPAPSGGPRITATGNQVVVNGGTQTVTITADAPFDTVYVFVGGKALGLIGEGAGGIDGFYRIRLPAAQTTSAVLLTFPQEIALTDFSLQFGVASPSGAVGPFVGLTTSVTQVGTGDVQVTLSWDVDSDVDLHVVGPGGDEVFYGRRVSPSGGELDLDSNAACQIDGKRNENITWPVGRAPRGQYIVRVDYWSSCAANRTNYTVRINNGGAVQIFTGFFTGSGDQGGLGSGRTIATFERTSGPAPLTAPLLRLDSAVGLTKTPASIRPAQR